MLFSFLKSIVQEKIKREENEENNIINSKQAHLKSKRLM